MTITTTLTAERNEDYATIKQLVGGNTVESVAAWDHVAAPYAIGSDSEEGIYYRVLNSRLESTGYEINLSLTVTPDSNRIATRLINRKGEFVDEFGSIVGALNHVSRYGSPA